MQKKRVLFINETSYLLHSGFARIGKQIIPRLIDTGKFEIFELGTYLPSDDPRIESIPWPYFPAAPSSRDEHGNNQYNSTMHAQFGSLAFESVALQTKCDAAVSWLDFWMFPSWFFLSPYSKYVKTIYSPMIDSEANPSEWYSEFRKIDVLMATCGFARKMYNRYDPKMKNLWKDNANFSVDHNLFKPGDKKEARRKLGIPEDCNLIVKNSRLQPRKNFVELLESFKLFLEICIEKDKRDLAENTFLLVHSSFPDVGIPIDKHLMRLGIGNRVLFTYICQACGKFAAIPFSTEICFCKFCGQIAAHCPNTSYGVKDEDMPLIYQASDLAVQMASCLDGDEEVYLSKGWIKIRDVKVGDMAYTHNNRFMPVVEVMEKYSTKIRKISLDSDFQKLTITEEHPVYCLSDSKISRTGRSLREYIGRLNSKGLPFPKPDFVKVKDLKKGDMVAYFIDDRVIDTNRIDISNYVNENKCSIIEEDHVLFTNDESKHKYPRFIEVDNDFCMLLGIFAANGNATTRGRVQISFSTEKKWQIQKTIDVLTKISGKTPVLKYYTDREAVEIQIYSVVLQNMFEEFFFGIDQSKRFPSFVSRLPLEKQKNILIGMFSGDGCYYTGHGKNVTSCSSISPYIINELKNLLRRQRIQFNVNLGKPRIDEYSSNRKPLYQLAINGDLLSWKLATKKTNTRGIYNGNIHYLKIQKIEDLDHNNSVYNFEVSQDNSYMTRISVVKNSEGLSLTSDEARSCGIPLACTNYAALSDKTDEKSISIEPGMYYWETAAQTMQMRVLSSVKDAAKQFYNFFISSDKVKKDMGEHNRNVILKDYTFDRAAKIFEEVIDTMTIHDPQTTWFNPIPNFPPNKNPAEVNHKNPEDFIDWCLINMVGRPDLITSNWKYELLKGLNTGVYIGRGGREPMNAAKIVEIMKNLTQKHHYYEQKRLDMLRGPQPKQLDIEIV